MLYSDPEEGEMNITDRANPRLLGALRKSGYEQINETHLSEFHSVSYRACGKRSRNMSLLQLAMLSTLFFVSSKRLYDIRWRYVPKSCLQSTIKEEKKKKKKKKKTTTC